MTMKKIMLTCKDSGKFFHDCEDCEHYDNCTYFQKNKQLEADMKKRNLTNKKIHKASALELIFRMNCLHAESERRPQDDGIPMTDIWEATAIVKELKNRLGRLGVFFAGGKIMTDNLTKKEIETISTMSLNMRQCRILERGETMDAKDIPVADAREILLIEDELRKRTIKAVGHDFYPPDKISKRR